MFFASSFSRSIVILASNGVYGATASTKYHNSDSDKRQIEFWSFLPRNSPLMGCDLWFISFFSSGHPDDSRSADNRTAAAS